MLSIKWWSGCCGGLLTNTMHCILPAILLSCCNATICVVVPYLAWTFIRDNAFCSFRLTCIVVQWVVELNDWSRVQRVQLKRISLHDRCLTLYYCKVHDHELLKGRNAKHSMLTAAIAFFACFNEGAASWTAVRMVRSGAVPGACSGTIPTGMRAGSMGPGRPTSLTWVRTSISS